MIRRLVTHAVFVAVAASAIHWATISLAPDFIMWRVMNVIGSVQKKAINFADRPTAAARTVVRPSPDLLYSTCLFDVSRQALKITTAAPVDTYWSVALYASNTDNFFVLNDRQANGKSATIYLVGKGQTVTPAEPGAIVVSSPTSQGLVLFRTLINDDARLGEIDQQRRQANCETVR
jgi:uncharacterized membrane protein